MDATSIANKLIKTFDNGGKVMICGNGGSSAEAEHFAGELMCHLLVDRPPLPALCLSSSNSVLTAISNDYGYEHIFSRQIQALGNKNDLVITITTSGKSKNILKAEQTCEALKIPYLRLPIDGDNTLLIQENHLRIIHNICYLVEKHYVDSD